MDPKDLANIRILRSGSETHDKGDSRNHGYQDPYAYVGISKKTASPKYIPIYYDSDYKDSRNRTADKPGRLGLTNWGLDNSKYQFEVYLRYPILFQYQVHGAIMLVIVEDLSS